jgi:hypothetical protein
VQPTSVDLDKIFNIPVRGVMDMAIDLETQRTDLYPMIWPIATSSNDMTPKPIMATQSVNKMKVPGSGRMDNNNTYSFIPQSVRSFRFFLFV